MTRAEREREREDHETLFKDLFADGNDFSSSTIEKGRNLFYQNALKKKIQNEMKELEMELIDGLNIHLNVNQTFLINSSSINVFFCQIISRFIS